MLSVILSLTITQTLVIDLTRVRLDDTNLVISTADDRQLLGQVRYLDFVVHDNVTRPPPPCKPITNVAFVKVHKAGSSTIANILQRYGILNYLSFALPNTKFHSYGYNYISRAGDVLTKDRVVPLDPGKQYNILFNHAIYNRTAFQQIMPEDTAYISILREPFQQFVSTFEYYRVDRYFASRVAKMRNATNPISLYLSNPKAFERVQSHFSYIKNKQSEDLGLGRDEYYSPLKLNAYLDQMDKDFKLVMILEHFDEALLLLKHELCWDIKDILYIPKNANKKKPHRNFTDTDYENHRKYNHLDYAVYHHFLRKFTAKLNSQKPDFFQELAHYKKLLQDIKNSCLYRSSYYVTQTRWHDSFDVTERDCKLMLMSELSGLDYLFLRSGHVSTEEYKKLYKLKTPAETPREYGKIIYQ